MRLPSRTRWWVALVGLSVSTLAAAGCLFPSFTFTGSGGGGAGGGTTASTTGSVTSSTASSGTGGAPPTDNCFNGVSGCDDPACSAVTECIDPIPVGWGNYGYVIIGEADPSMPVTCPSYGSTSAFSGFSGLLPGNASCSDCSCDSPTGQTCSITDDLNTVKPGLQFAQVRDVPCANPSATNIHELTAPSPWTAGMCSAIDTAPGGQLCSGHACNVSVYVGLPTVSGGMCNPQGGMLTKQGASWQTAATTCGGFHMMGCSGGKTCVPKPSAPFVPGTCIGKAGDQTCPAPFTKKHLYYTDFDDSRGCTSCTCGSPSGGACDISISLFTDAACTAANQVVTFSAGTCTDLTGNPTLNGRTNTVASQPQGASCTPDKASSTVTGTVGQRTSTATTFCCL
jgi:hypothetical protein